MPASGREILMIFRARNYASQTINAVGKSYAELGAEIDSASVKAKALGQGLISAAAMSGMAAAGGVAFFASAIKQYNTYQQAMSVAQTQTQGMHKVTLKQMEDLGTAVSTKVAVPLQDIPQAMYNMFSGMNINWKQTQPTLMAFAKAAVAGNTNVADVAKHAAQEMNAFKIPIKDVNQLLDLQFKMVSKGAGTYSDFMGEIGQIAPAMAAANQTVQTMSGMWAFLTRQGETPQSAAASISRAAEFLSKPKVQAGFNKLGVNLYDQHGHLLQMNQIINELATNKNWQAAVSKYGNIQNAFQATFGSGTIQARRFFDLALENPKAMNAMVTQMQHSHGFMQRSYSMVSKSSASQTQLLANQWHALQITIGQQVTPVFLHLLKAINGIFQAFDKLSPKTKHAIVWFGLLGTAAAGVGALVLGAAGAILTVKGHVLALREAASKAEAAVKAKNLKEADRLWKDATEYGKNAAIPGKGRVWNKENLMRWSKLTGKMPTAGDSIIGGEMLGPTQPPALMAELGAGEGEAAAAGGLALGPVLIAVAAIAALAAAVFLIIKYHKQLEKWIKPVWGAISSWGKKAWDDVYKAAMNVWHFLDKQFRPIIKSIAAWWNSHFKQMEQVARMLAKVIAGVLIVAMLPIIGVIALIWLAWKYFHKQIIDLIEGLAKLLIKTIGDLVKGILDLFGFLIDVLTGKWGKAWKDLSNAIGSFYNAVMGFIGTIITAIGKEFMNINKVIGSILLEAGKEIVKGLAAGIKDAGHFIFDGIKALGGGIVNAFKSFFGIHSPSKVFHALGQNLYMGLINGILEGKLPVSQALKDLTDISSLSGTTTVGSILGRAGTSQAVHIHPGAIQISVDATGQNPNDVSKAVQEGVQTALSQILTTAQQKKSSNVRIR